MKRYIILTSILLLGICFMVIGISNNEITIIFKKATKVCLECVGIG